MNRPLASDAGFSLVESLVALAIAGFIMIALADLVWLMAGQERRLAGSEADVSEAAAFAATIDRLFAAPAVEASALSLGEDGLSLVSHGLPQSTAAGGRARINLTLEGDGAEKRLVLNLVPLDGTDNLGASLPQTILGHLETLAIQVRVAGQWQSRWAGRLALPDLVRFTWNESGQRPREHFAVIGSRQTSTACLRTPLNPACWRPVP
jgi:prepilin-type N-terminal cleavage/methylation domain-containing protein